MLRNTSRSLIASILFMLASTAGAAQSPPSVPRILTEDEIKALFAAHSSQPATPVKHKFQHTVMEISAGAGRAFRIETFIMPPDHIVVVSSLPGIAESQTGYDGKIGWSVSEMTGPIILEGAPLEAIKRQAALPSQGAPAASYAAMLSVPQSKTYALGTDTLDGRAVNAILIVTSPADSSIMYFDASSGLMAGMRSIRAGGQPADTTSVMLFGDYRTVDGAKIPMTTRIRTKGRELVTRIVTFDHAPIGRARFIPPAEVQDKHRAP